MTPRDKTWRTSEKESVSKQIPAKCLGTPYFNRFVVADGDGHGRVARVDGDAIDNVIVGKGSEFLLVVSVPDVPAAVPRSTATDSVLKR